MSICCCSTDGCGGQQFIIWKAQRIGRKRLRYVEGQLDFRAIGTAPKGWLLIPTERPSLSFRHIVCQIQTFSPTTLAQTPQTLNSSTSTLLSLPNIPNSNQTHSDSSICKRHLCLLVHIELSFLVLSPCH